MVGAADDLVAVTGCLIQDACAAMAAHVVVDFFQPFPVTDQDQSLPFKINGSVVAGIFYCGGASQVEPAVVEDFQRLLLKDGGVGEVA